MQFALAEIAEVYTAQTGTTCEIVVGSSGKLTAQVIEGAPYDILIAANSKFPEEIVNKGLAVNSPQVYAYGNLALWTMTEGIMPTIAQLNSTAVQHIALANPRTAPYGAAAMEVLEYFELNEELSAKLVFGESIAQTNQFIHSQAAEIGFTALSVVTSPAMQGQGRWLKLPTASYSPIEQSAVVIKQSSAKEPAAIDFFNFLFSDSARKILVEFGYSVHE